MATLRLRGWSRSALALVYLGCLAFLVLPGCAWDAAKTPHAVQADGAPAAEAPLGVGAGEGIGEGKFAAPDLPEPDQAGADGQRRGGPPAGAPTKRRPANAEAYHHFVDNPFQVAARQPLSTFATDVDTASYSNVRRFLLNEAKMPPKDAVRVAGLINYFNYDYPNPTGEHPFGINTEVGACPWQPEHQLVRIGLQTRRVNQYQVPPPRNLTFLIDVSGSMDAPNRLPLVKAALALLVERLTDLDRVAIVVYAGRSGLVLPPTPGNDKQAILGALQRLEAGGSTNGGEGIQLAYRTARQNLRPDGVNRVILCTDGDFNVGVTDPDSLIRLIETERQAGVFLTILGFGMGNLKDATMERLAYHGHGHYAYVDSQAEARKVFVEEGASLVAVAKDVKVQVEFNPLQVQAYRLIGYENRKLEDQDFHDDQKIGGVLGAGHRVTALYEIVPPGVKLDLPGAVPLKYQAPAATPPAAAAAGELLTVKVRYKDPQADASKLLEAPVRAPTAAAGEPSADYRFAAAVAAFGMLLRESPYRGAATYGLVLDLGRKARGEDLQGHRTEFLKMVEAAELLARVGPAPTGPAARRPQ